MCIISNRFVSRATEWLAWSLVLNLIWEVAQLPLYAFPSGTSVPQVVFAVAHCTLGDVAVAFVAFAASAVLTKQPAWPVHQPIAGLVVAVCVTVGWTVWAEWNAVYVARSWAYAAKMPTIAGIGLSPLLQSIVLPQVTVAIVRAWARRESR